MRISGLRMTQRWEHDTLTQRSWGVQAAVDDYLVSEDCDLTGAQRVGDPELLNPSSSPDPALGNRASQKPQATSEALQTPAGA